MLTTAQQRRLCSARLDPPVTGRVGGALVALLSSVMLAWTLAGSAMPSLDTIVRTMAIAAVSWLSIAWLVRACWEPLVAILGDRLADQLSEGVAPWITDSIGALAVLTPLERRDLVAARVGAASTLREDRALWVIAGWAGLAAAGFAAGVEIWQLRSSPQWARADLLIFMSLLLIGLGSFAASRSRWRPIVAALREVLGEAAIASIPVGPETAARSEATAKPSAGLLPSEQRAVAHAQRVMARVDRNPLRQLLISMGWLVVAVYLLARLLGQSETGTIEEILAIAIITLATFESGYILAHTRWQRIVAKLQRSRRPGAGDSSQSDGIGE